MEILKCKNCGAQLDITRAVGGVVECAYCHSKLILAKSADTNAVNFLAIGENALDNGKFDEAYSAYYKAASLDGGEPEAYFGMALAANKVRYIKDVKNNRLQPICYDATDKSFASDANYNKALSLATTEQKNEYRLRAQEIDYIRSEFYKLKASGKAYDCFICVKVTGENGHKTADSERANDIYYHLKDKGYRPFYSEREIQNETGADYEARILYALFSSPCMLVVCSDEGYLQTPWVKNEYMRFVSLINDEQKETDSIAIGFFDTPIERLPGRNGRLQGVCLKNPDAYSKIVDFVDRHYSLNAEAPQISRKTYGQVAYQKKSVVKSQIQKRTLAKIERSAVTVSEQSKLDIAKSMLDGGNFDAVIARCKSILETNKSCALAYWYMFLAENKCKTAESFTQSKARIPSFDGLESAIATADGKLKNECYDALFNRAMADRQLYIYDEYISLPDSGADNIKRLTAAMHSALLESAITDASYKVFDTIIKTVDDTDTYIDMNLSFADKIIGAERDHAVKCYKAVIEIEASNGHALWQLFKINHNLNTTADVVAYLIFKENHGKIENELFAYGFNRYAVEQMLAACVENVLLAPQYNVLRFDFILSLVPKEEKQLYTSYLNDITDNLLINGQFTAANRFNDLIIAEEKYNDRAYFKRLYIKRKTLNLFDFAENCDSLYDDPDFSAAIDAYAEKHVGEQNIYIELVNRLQQDKPEDKIKKSIAAIVSLAGLKENVLNVVNEKADMHVDYDDEDDDAPIGDVLKLTYWFMCSDTTKELNCAIVADALEKYNFRWDGNPCEVLDKLISLFFTDAKVEEQIRKSDAETKAKGYSTTFARMVEINRDPKYGRFDDSSLDYVQLFIDSIAREILSLGDNGYYFTWIISVKERTAAKNDVACQWFINRLKEKLSACDRSDVASIRFKAPDITQSSNLNALEKFVFCDGCELTNISIPDSVTIIGNEAFSGCSELAKINLSNNIKTIGNKAFVGCSTFTEITIPESVSEIGNEAFKDCKRLTDIRVGNGVKVIGERAFASCTSLKSIVLPDSITELGGEVFYGCTGLVRVTFGSGIATIGKHAFCECSEVERVVLPDSLTSIGESAFCGCAKITDIEIPNSVTFVGDKAFSECIALTNVTMPKRLKKYRFSIFGDRKTIKHIKFKFIK